MNGRAGCEQTDYARSLAYYVD